MIGACARDTVLTGVHAPVLSVVTVTGRGAPAIIRNVTIANPPQIAILVEAGPLHSPTGPIAW